MFGLSVYTSGIYIHMRKQNTSLIIRLPKALHSQSLETARERGETLSAILRRHLEAYASAQPIKQAA